MTPPNDGTPHAEVLRDVLQERFRQLDRYTLEDDDELSFSQWWREIQAQLYRAVGAHEWGEYAEARKRLVGVAAITVAAVEAMDRARQAGPPSAEPGVTP